MDVQKWEHAIPISVPYRSLFSCAMLLVLHRHTITSLTHHTLTPHSAVTVGDESLAEMDLEAFMESGFMSGSEEEKEGEDEEEEETEKPKAKKPTMRLVFVYVGSGL